MQKLTEDQIMNLDNCELVKRMDEIISSSSFADDFRCLRMSVSSIIETKKVKSFDNKFQRKIAHKAFGLFLQIIYTRLGVQLSKNPFPKGDINVNEQLSWAASKQRMLISSRIIAEYFMKLLYMIGTGKELKGEKMFGEIKKWVKTPENPFVYFSISIARMKKYSREKRDSEVHANTKLAKKILTLSADEIDNSLFELLNIINNQWQYIVSISDGKNANGWSNNSRDEFDDKSWYEKILKSEKVIIDSKIDEMIPDEKK